MTPSDPQPARKARPARQRREPAVPDATQEEARALGDPTRHAIFRRLTEADGSLTVTELTEQAGCHHTAVRQHLAKLIAAGLVVEETEHRAVRGRPRLRYTAAPSAAGRWDVPGPYERLAVLLAEALRTGGSPADVGRRAARATGAGPAAGDPVAAVAAEMARQGFQPSRQETDSGVELVLGHCPYQAAALANPEAVCALHLGLAEGAAERVGGVEVRSLIPRDPRRAGCRLLLRPAPQGSSPKSAK